MGAEVYAEGSDGTRYPLQYDATIDAWTSHEIAPAMILRVVSEPTGEVLQTGGMAIGPGGSLVFRPTATPSVSDA